MGTCGTRLTPLPSHPNVTCPASEWISYCQSSPITLIRDENTCLLCHCHLKLLSFGGLAQSTVIKPYYNQEIRIQTLKQRSLKASRSLRCLSEDRIIHSVPGASYCSLGACSCAQSYRRIGDFKCGEYGSRLMALKSSLPLRGFKIKCGEKQGSVKIGETPSEDNAELLEDHVADSSSPDHESEEKMNDKVTVEISSSVMRMLQGMEDSRKDNEMGLIEKNLRKRRSKFSCLEEEKQSAEESGLSDSVSNSGSLYQVSSKMNTKTEDSKVTFLRNSSVRLPYTKTFDHFWPESVISFVEFLSSLENRRSVTRRVLEKVQLDTKHLKEVLQNDLDFIDELQMFPSMLFLDLNGLPLNPGGHKELERQFLLPMYILYRCFHRLNYFENLTTSEALYGRMFIDHVLQICSCGTDEEGLQKNIFYMSPFLTDNKYIRTRYGTMFLGKIAGSTSFALREIQKRLDQNYDGLSGFLLKCEAAEGVSSGNSVDGNVWCLVARNRSFWSFSYIEPYNLVLGVLLLVGVVIGSASFDLADPGLDRYLLWAKGLVPLGVVGVVGAGSLARKSVALYYNVSHLVNFPLLLPIFHQGTLSNLVLYKGCLPSRSCLLDLSVFSSCASLAVSSLLLVLATCPFLSWNHALLTVADFRGHLLVPSDLFSYSYVLTWLLEKLSVATLLESGKLQYVLNPFALGALLGFNFTFTGLVPGSALDGGRILGAVFGRSVQRKVAPVLYIYIVLIFCLKSPLLGLLWVALMPVIMLEDHFQRDEVTEPSYVRKATGLLLVSAGLLSFVPALW